MLAAAALNKNTSLLSCRIKSIEKEDMRLLWREQTATVERYNHKKEKSLISQCHNTVGITGFYSTAYTQNIYLSHNF